MRVNSQFPQPDLHRQDMRPYGLRTKNTKSSENAYENPFVLFVSFVVKLILGCGRRLRCDIGNFRDEALRRKI
jgi:hypothetical protein